MYDIIKSTIERGAYNLATMLGKIDAMWIQNDITDEQRATLISSAQSHAKAEYSFAPLQKQIDALAARIVALNERITAIEKGEPPVESDEWPEWFAYDGIPPVPWQNGSKCTHNSQKYISRVDNNIWEPGALGVSSAIWEQVEA